jgi:hypothetical protein
MLALRKLSKEILLGCKGLNHNNLYILGVIPVVDRMTKSMILKFVSIASSSVTRDMMWSLFDEISKYHVYFKYTQGQILVRLIEVFAMPAQLTLFILNNCISYFQNILPIPVALRYLEYLEKTFGG